MYSLFFSFEKNKNENEKKEKKLLLGGIRKNYFIR